MPGRPARRPTPARSPREWTVRGGLAAAALALGYVSTAQTLGYTLVRTNPERAFALSPNDGRVAGALAQQIAASEGADRKRADTLASRALAAEPLSVKALTALGIDTQLAGDTVAARRIFRHSDALSRREFGTRLWLIEDAVGRGDVQGALQNYDIALRTEKGAPDLLFPVLANAIADAPIATGLLRMLAKRPPWGDGFVAFIGGANANPIVNARFLRRLSDTGFPVADVAKVNAINNLIVSGAIEDGWRYYQSVRKGATRQRSRDPEFDAALAAASMLDWTPIMGEPGISAVIDGGVFDFAAPATVGGVVLQQTQLLPPGRYALQGTSANIDQADDARPYWQLLCFDGRELSRIDVSSSPDAKANFAGTFVVPTGCAAQTLRLMVRPSTAVGGSTGQIERVALTPAGAPR